MQFTAAIDGIDLELFAYWADRDLRGSLKQQSDLKANRYERSWLVEFVGSDAIHMVDLRVFHTRLDRLNVEISALADPEFGLSGALCLWIAHRWDVAVKGAPKAGKEIWLAMEEEPKRADVEERVLDAHRLLKGGKTKQSVAFSQAHTNRDTYIKYCKAVTGEEPLVRLRKKRS